MIHEPDNDVGYYGADVSGPVFKRIAQKIFTDTPMTDEFENLDPANPKVEKDFNRYYSTARKTDQLMPDLTGMPGMDALSILENLGLRVELTGVGEVRSQSIPAGAKIEENKLVKLKLS